MFTIKVEVNRSTDENVEDYALRMNTADNLARSYQIGQFRYIPGMKKCASNAARVGIVKKIPKGKVNKVRKPRARKLPEIGDITGLFT